MKIMINSSYGGFGFSDKVYEELINLGWTYTEWKYDFYDFDAFSKLEEQFDLVYCDAGYKSWISGYSSRHEMKRTDPLLIDIVERIGTEEASGKFADIKIIEIPDDIEYEIMDYDGAEWVAEKHRVWY